MSAGLLFAVAAGKGDGARSRVLRHAERWAESPDSTVMNIADAVLLAWTLDAGELRWIEAQCRGGVLRPVVEFASWLQAVERGEDPGPAPASALADEWFRCRCFRGPRRLLARRRGAAAGRCDANKLDRWLVPVQNAGMPTPSEGQGVVMVEWAIAAVRAWPDRGHLLRTDEPTLRDRTDGLRSSVVTHLVGLPGADALVAWLDGSIRALTIPADASRTVRGLQSHQEPAAAALARST